MARLTEIRDASKRSGFPEALENALLADLRGSARQGINSRISLCVDTAQGQLGAGLEATTSYGWLHVNMLWVAAECRRAGQGRALLEQAHALARDRGCHASWLDTSSAAARVFYERCGYDVFASLKNEPGQEPAEHTRWFLRCSLV